MAITNISSDCLQHAVLMLGQCYHLLLSRGKFAKFAKCGARAKNQMQNMFHTPRAVQQNQKLNCQAWKYNGPWTWYLWTCILTLTWIAQLPIMEPRPRCLEPSLNQIQNQNPSIQAWNLRNLIHTPLHFRGSRPMARDAALNSGTLQCHH